MAYTTPKESSGLWTLDKAFSNANPKDSLIVTCIHDIKQHEKKEFSNNWFNEYCGTAIRLWAILTSHCEKLQPKLCSNGT